MDKNIVKELFKKYAEGNCTPDEQVLVDRWYLSEAAKRTAIDPKNPIEEHDLIWKGLQSQLSLNNHPEGTAAIPPEPKTVKTFRLNAFKWIAAASVVLIGSFLVYQIFLIDNHENLMAEIRKNDISPGMNKATLTLPNGKAISLSESKTGVVIDAKGLAYTDGTTIASPPPEGTSGMTTRSDAEAHPNAMVQPMDGAPEVSVESWKAFSRNMLSVNTPRGGTYQVLLPDGSKVWLNAASSLSFPQQFDSKSRIVLLKGEAYFEIAKKPDQPFKVLTIGQHVTVLGTHFNVNAYRDEPAPRTTLVEGSVNVSWANQNATITPGQQAVMENKSFKVTKVNVEEVLSWKNGKFKFSNESIESLMRKISRWYDVDVEYRGEITKEKFGGQVSKFSKVSDILEVLQLTGFVHFKIENRTTDTGNPNKMKQERRIIVLP